MKTKKITLIALLALFTGGASIRAQEQKFPEPGVNLCSTHEAMEEYYSNNPQAKAEHDQLEQFTQQYIPQAEKSNKSNALPKYRIPVVCHVYGNNFWGKALTDAQITNAIAEVTRDFQALNADFATVNAYFVNIKSGIDVSFELAKKDPKGNPTNGIDRKTTTGAGYGNGSGYDSKIAADAWDCKKYFNVYIVADLYNDGATNNSGVCWYPDVNMTNANTARCVFNGQYIGTNSTNVEFRSVLTHEFGHFLNLAHTFDTGCSGTGDGVSDTPLHYSTSLGCPTGQTSYTPVSDCGNWIVNSENYMDYNGAFCGQKNFTKGQVARMKAALNANNVTRFPLWQTSNLIATGLLDPLELNSIDAAVAGISVYPNPSTGSFNLEMNIRQSGNYKIEIADVLGRMIYESAVENKTGFYKTSIDLNNQPKGMYFISITGSAGKKTMKLVNE
ncbi:MAG TPA: zinc-dependent metalloprotease [Bacteroidia bacterium]|nr:zinc-dependent metalloprotease [Bacteroidia bacterium]